MSFYEGTPVHCQWTRPTPHPLLPFWILRVSNNKDNFQQRLPPPPCNSLCTWGGGGGFTLAGSKGTLRQTLISSRAVSLSVDRGGEEDKPGELVSACCRKNPFARPPTAPSPPDRTEPPGFIVRSLHQLCEAAAATRYLDETPTTRLRPTQCVYGEWTVHRRNFKFVLV